MERFFLRGFKQNIVGHDQDRNNLLNFMIQAYNMHAESFGIHFSVILKITSEEI